MVTNPINMTEQELDFLNWAKKSTRELVFSQSCYIYPIVRLHNNGVSDDILLSEVDERTIVDKYAPEDSKRTASSIRKFRKAIRLYREYHTTSEIQREGVLE